MSTCGYAYTLLFLVLLVNSNQFQFICSYSSRPPLCALDHTVSPLGTDHILLICLLLSYCSIPKYSFPWSVNFGLCVEDFSHGSYPGWRKGHCYEIPHLAANSSIVKHLSGVRHLGLHQDHSKCTTYACL